MKKSFPRVAARLSLYAFVLLALCGPAAAQTVPVTYYIQIPGIMGESIVKGATGAIDVQSFSFGDGNSVTLSSITGTWKAGRPSFANFAFTSATSKASPLLFYYVAAGTQFPSATLTGTGTTPDGRRLTVTYTLRNVFIVGYAQEHGGDPVPLDSVKLAFGSLTYDYLSVSATGVSTRSTTCFNMETGAGSPTSGGC